MFYLESVTANGLLVLEFRQQGIYDSRISNIRNEVFNQDADLISRRSGSQLFECRRQCDFFNEVAVPL